MSSLVVDCTIRSIVIALGTGAVLRLMRIRHPSMRHAAWTGVIAAMLLMPIWSLSGLKLSVPVPTRAVSIVPASVLAVAASAEGPTLAGGEPSATNLAGARATSSNRFTGTTWTLAFVAIYLVGAGVFLLRLLVGVIYAVHLRHRAVLRDGHLTSDQCASPITIGWITPSIVLPNNWPAWNEPVLKSILQHERAHARRRDPLVQTMALVNRAVFWFHPLAWWLERRVTALAEESCDAAVLAAGHSAITYAGTLLDVARAVKARGLRLRAVGMAMPGSHLEQRLRRILSDAPAPSISRARVAWTAALCALSTVVFAAAGVTPSGTKDLAQQTSAAAYPTFDVVSVRPCAPGALGQTRGASGDSGGSPGLLYLQCLSPYTMMQEAYIYFANGRGHRLTSALEVNIERVPDWMKSERFTVEAKTDQNPAPAVMRGPMLQAVLEDQFKLKVHHESREVPIYELVIGKSGAKVSPYTGTDCVLKDDAAWPPPALPAGQKYCTARTMSAGDKITRAGVMSLDDLASLLNFDPPLVNKTGISAPVSFSFEYRHEDTTNGPPASLVTALRDQLGLDVHLTKGPRDFLVVEHAERPAKQ